MIPALQAGQIPEGARCRGRKTVLRREPGSGGRRLGGPLRYVALGGVPERSNGAVSKTVKGASSSRVQIPPPPLNIWLKSAWLSRFAKLFRRLA